MSVDRRFVLKGMALGSLAGLTMGAALPSMAGLHAAPGSSAGRPVLTLVGQGAENSAFVQGARAAGSQLVLQQVDSSLAFMLDLESRLRSGQPMQVMGLLDDASAALVLDLARSAGARVNWIGQHMADAGHSRHHLLNTHLTEGCSRQLSRQLHACGAGFTLSEERQNSAAPARQLAGPARSTEHAEQWAASLGYLLGSLGIRRPAMAPLVTASRTPLSGSFVSFSIET